MKRFLVLTLALTLSLGVLCSPAFASENEARTQGVIIEAMYDNDVELRLAEPPREYKNLGGSNNYTANIVDLAAARGTYTKYYFTTSTGKIYVKTDLVRSGTTATVDRKLEVRLYEKATASSIGSIKKTETIEFDTSEVTERVSFTGLDVDKFYYISFFNVSSTNAGSRLDMSGTALIDDTYN